MPFPVLAALGAAVASSAASAGGSYLTQKNLNRQAQANYEKNMALSYHYNQQQARAVVRNLRDAGLSPALANNTSMPAVSAAMPSPGSAPAPAPDFVGAINAATQSKLADSQIDVNASNIQLNASAAAKNEAEANKAQAEADNINRDVVRKQDFDATVNAQIREYFSYRANSAKSDAEREVWQALASESNDYSAGTLEAQAAFASFVNELDEYDLQHVLRALSRLVTSKQIESAPVVDALVNMPFTNRQKMFAEIAEAWSSAKFRDFQRVILGPAQSDLLVTEESLKHHSDIRRMIHEDDYTGAGLALLPYFLQGAGLLTSAYIMRGRFAGGAPAPSGPGFGPGFGPGSAPGSAPAMPSSVLKQIQANAAKVANGNKVYEAQLIDAAVRKWKASNK